MVRTRADNCARKAVAAKAPRKTFVSAQPTAGGANSPGAAGGKYAGGNPVCPRPTPDWQKKIGKFFVTKPKSDEETNDQTVPSSEATSNDMEITECGSSSSSSSQEPAAGGSREEPAAGSSSREPAAGSSKQAGPSAGTSATSRHAYSDDEEDERPAKNGLIDDSDED